MARRSGLTIFPLASIEKIVERERTGQWDLYAPIASVRFEVRDSLAAPAERYAVQVSDGRKNWSLRLTGTALSQFCSIAGIPAPFLEKVPAPLGLSLLSCLLEMSDAGDGRRFLFRLKNRSCPELRAVLPQSYCRLDDLDVLAELRTVTKNRNVEVIRFTVDDDSFFVRLLIGEAMNIGTMQKPDRAYVGFDVITSETGRHPIELRYVAFRQICQNGLTVLSEAQNTFRARYTLMQRHAFEEAVRSTLEGVARTGPELTRGMAASRGVAIEDPMSEVDQIFRKYRLGSVRGRLGRWVVAEVVRNIDLFGVRKFDLIQAFTAVAKGLGNRDRIRLEDAMGSYLLDGLRRN